MQGIAWMKMAVAYSAEDGIVQGVKKTFDGDHPCRLCCAIEQARQEQDQSPQAPLLPKANELKIAKEFMPLGEISLPVVFPRETELEARRDPVLSDGQPAASPQSPPPRLV
jgi:hypothetical protein